MSNIIISSTFFSLKIFTAFSISPTYLLLSYLKLVVLTISPNSSIVRQGIILGKSTYRLLKLINAMASPIPKSDKELINIHEVTEHVIELFKYDADNVDVNFIKDYDPSIPQLTLDRHQIIQSLINILRNAIQAINKNGNITIKTRPIFKYTIGDIKHDLVVKIDVIDNGIGIPEEKLKEIFYPMVTTKNEGMGLGLTIAQSIIIENKGIIECKSKNKETIFSIILPWSDNE